MATRTATHDQMIEKADELEEIAAEMRVLLDQAHDILRGTGIIGERAKTYWLGHMESFLNDDGGSCTTVLDTIIELRGEDEED